MEKFDFGALLHNNQKKHKIKPAQFVSVAGGVTKRLETNIKNRKSSRLTVFDTKRNLGPCTSPAQAPSKIEHRRQQLEKWKAEKEAKKKEAAAQKKKPFLAGVPHNPKKFVPPPPVPKPSVSGRVTRSQSRITAAAATKKKTTPKQRSTQSFAPKNAVFQPPKNLVKLPSLVIQVKTKIKKASTIITFDPITPNSQAVIKPTRSANNRQTVIDTKTNTKSNVASKSNTKTTLPKKTRTQNTVKSSSSTSDIESRKTRTMNRNLESSASASNIDRSKKVIKRVKTPAPKKGVKEKNMTPKVLLMQSSQTSSSSSEIEPSTKIIKRVKTPGPNKVKKTKDMTPKILLKQSSTESTSSSSDSDRKVTKKPSRKSFMMPKTSSESDRGEITSLSEENNTIISLRKSFPCVIPRSLQSNSSSEFVSSDGEIMSPIVRARKSLPNTPKNRIPKSESASEEKLRSPNSPNTPLTPAEMAKQISPYVTVSRGKDNARRETMWKMAEGLLDDDASNINNVDHFRQQLTSEIARLTALCDTWDQVQQATLPETVQEAILSAVGQARLLMSQKMQQFSSLVERCARPEPGSPLVTPADLHGFWDMLFMQVENVDMRFKKLGELRARGWVEEAVQVAKKAVKQTAKRAVRPVASSRIKDMIAAARKAKQQDSQQTVTSEDKMFEAGFFCVRSPVKSPVPVRAAPATPLGKHTLLKAVLSSEAKKASASKNSTSFAMLRASILGKNMEYDGIALLQQTPQMTPVNVKATPGRSILKSTNIATNPGKKSIKLVLFDDSDNECKDVSTKDTHENEVSGDSRLNAIENSEELIQDSEMSTAIEKLEPKDNKENKRKLKRQDAIEDVLTRYRMSLSSPHCDTEVQTPRRSTRKKNQEAQKTPKSGSKKVKETESVEKTPKRSSRKKALKEVDNLIEDVVPMPKRSSRKKNVGINAVL